MIKDLWLKKPLFCILSVAGFFRLIAVIFSKGYGMHDDHFLVIEASQSWVDGYDYNHWLPMLSGNVTPSGHNLLYPGLHYFLFYILQFLGVDNPQTKMYIVRFIHAAWSMLTVYFGYKIALKRGGQSAANITGLLLAALFFMPMMSVRNLVEFVCIPFLVMATWVCIKSENTTIKVPFFVAGLLLGLAINIRFQTLFFTAGFGLVFLIQQKWKQLFLIVGGFAAAILFVQAVTDMIVWHRPFVEIGEYIRYNLENSTTYGVQKWYNYILLVCGILIPPVSIFLLFGFLKEWKKHLLLFLPAFVFFVFHSSFPNKQERFILPAIPFIIILGCIGWQRYIVSSPFWRRNKTLYRVCIIFFWSLNIPALFAVSPAYSHRNRVEAMVFLSQQPDFRNFVIEESHRDDYVQPPLFYLKHWVSYYNVTTKNPLSNFINSISNIPDNEKPDYVIFNQEDNIEKRVTDFKKEFPKLTYVATIQPSFIDNLMHRLNKHNANFTSYIYKLEY